MNGIIFKRLMVSTFIFYVNNSNIRVFFFFSMQHVKYFCNKNMKNASYYRLNIFRGLEVKM